MNKHICLIIGYVQWTISEKRCYWVLNIVSIFNVRLGSRRDRWENSHKPMREFSRDGERSLTTSRWEKSHEEAGERSLTKRPVRQKAHDEAGEREGSCQGRWKRRLMTRPVKEPAREIAHDEIGWHGRQKIAYAYRPKVKTIYQPCIVLLVPRLYHCQCPLIKMACNYHHSLEWGWSRCRDKMEYRWSRDGCGTVCIQIWLGWGRVEVGLGLGWGWGEDGMGLGLGWNGLRRGWNGLG